MARRPLDLYRTNVRQTQALIERVPIAGRIVECCAGPGDMARVLAAAPAVTRVFTNDIDEAHSCHYHSDATDPLAMVWTLNFDWAVSNLPFGRAPEILPLAFPRARVGVAFILRLSFLEPCPNRAEWLSEHVSYFHGLFTFGQPRPSYTEDGRTDSVTTAWMIWTKLPPQQRTWRPFDVIYRWNDGT